MDHESSTIRTLGFTGLSTATGLLARTGFTGGPHGPILTSANLFSFARFAGIRKRQAR
jgi:hypothetical protein